MNPYTSVASVDELRLLDDTDLVQSSAVLITGETWFLIDRSCSEPDDGKSCLSTHSGNGMWRIMTPATENVIASLLND